MKTAKWIFPLLAFCVVLSGAIPAAAWHRTRAVTFAILPPGASGPEGLAVNPDNGNVYVGTFGFTATGSASGEGQVYAFTPSGRLVNNFSIAGSTPHLLGVAFNPSSKQLLVIDFGGGKVFSVDPASGAATVFITLPATLPHPGGSGLNAMTFDQAGNVYVSDSFQGVIWKTGPAGGEATAWADSPLLATTGVPPFGANGMVFNHAGTLLFVANTGNDTILQIPVNSNGAAGTVAVFTNSINGADGIAIDEHDNLWVAANQEDEIVVVDPTGKAIAKLGDFYGVQNGIPRGLLFPASPAFSLNGQWLYVTNLALDLRLFNPSFIAIDSAWTAQVMRYTVSKIPAIIPPLQGEGNEP